MKIYFRVGCTAWFAMSAAIALSFQDVGGGGVGGGNGGGGNEDKPVASIEGPAEILVGKTELFTIHGNGGIPFAPPNAPYDFFACSQCVPLENEPHCAPGPIQVVGEPDVANVRPYWICASPIGNHVLRAMVADSQVLNSDIVEKQFEVLPPDKIKPFPPTYTADANIGPNGGLFGATFAFRIQRGAEQIGPCATGCAEIKLWNLDEEEPRSYMGLGCDCSQNISPVCVQSPFIHVPFV